MTSLRLGLLADTSIQLSKLESIVSNSIVSRSVASNSVASNNIASNSIEAKADFSVVVAMVARPESLGHLPDVDVWVVRIDADEERSQAYIEYLDGLDIPVIYDETDSYSALDLDEQARRFSKKIASCGFMLDDIEHDDDRRHAKYVWVLAASAGGPEAVMSFIKNVPDDIANVAFVYVQHMDENMSEALVKTLKRNSQWQVFYCAKRHAILEKSIYLVSPTYQLDIDEAGVLNPSNTVWDGPYQPSVDQVVAKIWRQYKKDSGVIVFSGMGNDGAKNCRMIKNAGGQVWIQTPESCAVDSMPREVLNTKCVRYKGTPEQLARNFSCYQKDIEKKDIELGKKEQEHKKLTQNSQN